MAAQEDTTLTVIFLLVVQQISMATGETASVCLNRQSVLKIKCGTGHMLRITKSFYGYSELGSCHFTAGDCTQAEREAYPCTGLDNCSINLPSGGFGQKLTSCDRYNTEKYSSYFQVEYFCQPVIQTTDICSTRYHTLTQQSGFISTPQYPKNYPQGQDCLIQISVQRGQTINLTVIDMDLPFNGTFGCKDWMYAFNQDRSVTLCGRRTNERLTTLRSNELSIRFQSHDSTNKKGFWIYYEAYPPLSTTVPTIRTERHTTRRPDVPQVTTNKPIQTTPNVGNENDNKEPKQKLPFVAIVAGVIGSLTFILIVLLMLLVYRWYQDKQPYRVKSQHVEYLDARNPAFRSSTGTEFQGIEIYYNC